MTRLGPAPPATSPAVAKSMRGNRGKNTVPEVQLRRMLRKAGYPGYRLHWNKAPGHPDIAYPGRRVAIFVNGCFWHRCPKCDPPLPRSNTEFWTRKFELNRARDQRKIDDLEVAGWIVVTVWECELSQSAETVVHDLVRLLLSRDSLRGLRQ